MCSTASRPRRSTRACNIAREQAIFGDARRFYGWHYPPFFLGLAALLALMPYRLALLVWQGVTLALYLLAIARRILTAATPAACGIRSPLAAPRRSPFPPCSSISATAITASSPPRCSAPRSSQLDRRPLLAGMLIGLHRLQAAIRPADPAGACRERPLARLLPPPPQRSRVLALAVTLAFGTEVWTRLPRLAPSSPAPSCSKQGETGWYKIQSVFSWVRMWGGGIALAYAAQARGDAGGRRTRCLAMAQPRAPSRSRPPRF